MSKEYHRDITADLKHFIYEKLKKETACFTKNKIHEEIDRCNFFKCAAKKVSVKVSRIPEIEILPKFTYSPKYLLNNVVQRLQKTCLQIVQVMTNL